MRKGQSWTAAIKIIIVTAVLLFFAWMMLQLFQALDLGGAL